MRRKTSLSLALGAGLGLVGANLATAGGTPFLTGDAGGRLTRSDITIGQNQTGVVPIAPVSSTGEVAVMNTHLYAAGANGANLPGGAIGGAAAVIGASNAPTDGFSYGMIGTGAVTYFDVLTVESASLPDGTPVTVEFVYQVAWSGAANCSFLGGGTSLFARSAMNVSSNVSSASFGGASLDSFFLSSADNRAFFDTGSGASIINGLFAGAQQTTMTLNAEVGGTIDFAVTLDTDAISEVFPLSGDNQTGDASASIGLAFGASPAASGEGTSDVQIVSTLRGEPFSPASAANPTNAEAARPIVPPEACPADLNGSGTVDGADLGLLLQAWDPTGPTSSPADLNGDGAVDGADLGLLLQGWGVCS